MLTVEALKSWGASVDEGLGRCLNNEQFYLKLVKKMLANNGLDDLKKAVEDNDLKRAFEHCHALKGVLGNLSLTPLFNPASEMTELLRAGKEADYQSYLAVLFENMNSLKALAAE